MRDDDIEEGAPFNLRDLGGCATAAGEKVRVGLAFRSDNLAQLSDARASVPRDLAIRTVIDLRSDSEGELTGPFRAPSGVASYHHIPLVADIVARVNAEEIPRGFLAEMYREMLRESGAALRQVFAVLADPESYPLAVYCVFGKDRTGVVSALLKGLLGVSRQGIVTDYATTALSMERAKRWFENHDRAVADIFKMAPAELLSARPESMESLLDYIDDSYGSCSQYLEGVGVSVEELRSIRGILLEPPNGD